MANSKEFCDRVRQLSEEYNEEFVLVTQDRCEWSFDSSKDSLLKKVALFVNSNIKIKGDSPDA